MIKNQNYIRTYSCSNFTKFQSPNGKEPEKLFVPKALQIQQVNSIMLTPIDNILKIIFLQVHVIRKKYMNMVAKTWQSNNLFWHGGTKPINMSNGSKKKVLDGGQVKELVRLASS